MPEHDEKSEVDIKSCDKEKCFVFYMSKYDIYCARALEVFRNVLNEFGIPESIVKVIDLDDGDVDFEKEDILQLPTMQFCDSRICGTFNELIDEIRNQVMSVLLNECHIWKKIRLQ
jgi:hypothetical protein